MSRIQQTALILSLIFIFQVSNFLNAQTGSSITKFYVYAGGGGGNYKSSAATLGLRTVFKNKWSGSVCYLNISMDPKNLPSDYKPGVSTLLLFTSTNPIKVNMDLISISAGKYINLGKKIWATTEAGLSCVIGEKASFHKSSETGFNWILLSDDPSNYRADLTKHTAIGAMVSADFHYAISRFFGMSAGLFANINSIQSPMGFQIKLIAGNFGIPKKANK
jgi:hypothetical protein